MKIKMVIFDLDGTLINSSMDICGAINYAIEGTGIKPVSVERTITLVGEGISKLFEKLMAAENVQVDPVPIVSRFTEYYEAHLVDNTPLYPGVEETLKALEGYKKVIVSNKREMMSVRVLQALGIAKYFDYVSGSDTAPDKKPSPVPIQLVLAKYDIKPSEAVIVGDSNYDVDAGLAAGIKTIAVTYGYRPVHELKHAHFMVDKFTDILPIIKNLGE
jgi:phosphoglycolate phosphatase